MHGPDGPLPVIGAPAVQGLGNLAAPWQPRPDEKNLARLAVALVRPGVWRRAGTPAPHGLWEHRETANRWRTRCVRRLGRCRLTQNWVGPSSESDPALHRWLPAIRKCHRFGPAGAWQWIDKPLRLVEWARQRWRPPKLPKPNTNTPPELAQWLVDLAKSCTR